MTKIQTSITSSNQIEIDSETIFAIGNGPSLKGVDLHSLSAYPTIGMNAAYRYWRKIDWRPTYYACLDEVVGLSHKDAIKELIQEGRIEKFILRSNLVEALGEIANTDSVLNFDAMKISEPLFEPPAITTGSHSALWAGVLGFKQIILLGIDSNYKQIIDGATKIENEKNQVELKITSDDKPNPNYFFDDYQQVGDKYNIPNPRPDLHVNAWHVAGAYLSQNKATVYNGNPDSAVKCFSYIDLNELLSGKANVSPAKESFREFLPPEAIPPKVTASPSKKIKQFLAASLKPLLLGALLTLALFSLALGANWKAFALLSSFIFAGLIMSLIYIRFATINHLNKLQSELNQTREKLADFDRRYTRPETDTYKKTSN